LSTTPELGPAGTAAQPATIAPPHRSPGHARRHLGPLVRQVLAGIHRPARGPLDTLFASLQPASHVSRLGRRELFQWAGQDIFVSASIRKQFAEQVPLTRVELYPTADHQLTTAAETDRDAFLEHELNLR
jgi:hypothetical protein